MALLPATTIAQRAIWHSGAPFHDETLPAQIGLAPSPVPTFHLVRLRWQRQDVHGWRQDPWATKARWSRGFANLHPRQCTGGSVRLCEDKKVARAEVWIQVVLGNSPSVSEGRVL